MHLQGTFSDELLLGRHNGRDKIGSHNEGRVPRQFKHECPHVAVFAHQRPLSQLCHTLYFSVVHAAGDSMKVIINEIASDGFPILCPVDLIDDNAITVRMNQTFQQFLLHGFSEFAQLMVLSLSWIGHLPGKTK